MNKRYTKFIPIAALALSLGACSEDMGPRPEIPDMSGKDVNFSLIAGKDTRTYYGNESWNTGATDADIFWGDPFTNHDEQVMVYGQYAGRNVGYYTVKGFTQPTDVTVNGVNKATTLTKNGEMGVQWGAKPEGETPKVTFFSVYPANQGAYMNQGDPANGKFRASLISEQTPVGYSLEPSLLSPATKPSSKRTIVAYPNMDGAIMVAKSEVGYGAEQVPLTYSVITNVLDVTVFGPTRALLNSADADYVDIYSVYIKSTDGSAIAGEFDYDVNQASPEAATSIASGNTQSQITLNFNKTTSTGGMAYPRLYNYGTTGSTSTDEYNTNEVDQLRFRAFLLPGVNPQNLEITVNTNLGPYQLKSGQLVNFPSSFTAGNIHRMKLPMLNMTGRGTYDYSRWMEQIDPTVYATELSIPGSWNSFQLVSDGTNAGNVGNTTQGYQVTNYLDQYAKGVRAFVLRVSAFNNNNNHNQSSTGTLVRVQTGWGYNYSDFSINLNDVLNQLGQRVNGTKEFVVLILRGPGTPPYVTFDRVKSVLDDNQYVYKGEITPETTVGDLAGKIVVKINVQQRDSAYAGTVPSSTANPRFPSMFSEWAPGTNATTKSVPLDWGAWTEGNEGTEDIEGNTGMRWCFSECDNVVLTGTSTVHANVSTVSQREAAVDAYITKSLSEYNRKEHDTWMYLVIGGNIANNVTASKYDATNYAAEVATALNTYTYGKLSVADRQPCPMGIVMMNYASSTNATYNSANLIRTIINNNNAFVMQKRGSSGGSTDTPSTTSLINGGSAINPTSRRR